MKRATKELALVAILALGLGWGLDAYTAKNRVVPKYLVLPEEIKAACSGDRMSIAMHGDTAVVDFYVGANDQHLVTYLGF